MEVKTCSYCGEIIEEEYLEYNGDFYCEDCRDAQFSPCEICGDFCPDDEIYKTQDDEYICYECLSSHYSMCDYCNEYVHDDEAIEVVNYGIVCNDCLHHTGMFNTCDDCNEWYHIDDLIVVNGNFYCEDCRDIHSSIQTYHHHHNNEPIFFGDNKNNTIPYLGVELEVDNGDESNLCAKNIINLMPSEFIYMETDGSLNSGFENITQPATFEYHSFIRDNYKEMFKTAIDYGFRSHNTQTCGLHVHFNRDYFSKDVSQEEYERRIIALLYLVEKFWNQLVKFSRRKVDRLERWARKYNGSPQEIVEDMKAGCLERYMAVNLTNKNTIEFRMFRGTLKVNTFMATLEICNNLIVASKYRSIEELQSMEWEDLLTSQNLKDYWEVVKDRGLR